MASTTKLRLKFGTMSGTKTWNFNYAETTQSASAVKTLMSTMITNGSIYKYPPLTAESAEVVQTTSTSVDIS